MPRWPASSSAGRGPEIEGTRITVYNIMDYVVNDSPPSELAEAFNLTADEVQAALDYIAANRAEVDAEYAKILERSRNARNPEWVEALSAKSWEEIRQRRFEARRGCPGVE